MKFKLGQQIIDKIRCKKTSPPPPANKLSLLIQKRETTPDQIQNFIFYLNDHFSDLSISILDIGARGGLSKSEFAPLIDFKNKTVVGVEADPTEKEHLLSDSYGCHYNEVYDVGLYNKNGDATLYLTKVRGCTSLLEPNNSYLESINSSFTDWFVVEEKLLIKTTTLKDLFPHQSFDFLKVDVQGVDYDVLQASTEDFWSNTIGMFIEANTIPYYKNHKLMGFILNFMADKHFETLSIMVADASDGIDTMCEIAFIHQMQSVKTTNDFLKHCLFSLVARKTNYAWHLIKNRGEEFLSAQQLYDIKTILNLPELDKNFKVPID